MLRQKSVKYNDHIIYPADHWALDNTKEGTCIAFITFKNEYKYAVKLNPTDRRGYRALITYVGQAGSEIQKSFNRPYSALEQKGLSEATAFMIQIFKQIVTLDDVLPIIQTAQAGNNSQSLDSNGVTQIGNQSEPSMLHMHIWGRGNPKQEYIAGVPLEGPEPGKMFDMMAKTPDVPGNNAKVKWDAKQLEAGLRSFNKIMDDYINTTEFKELFGDTLSVKIYQSPKLSQSNLFAAKTTDNKVIDGATPSQQNPLQNI